jgi:transcriptional regulator with XRE-family HTH domain
MDLDEVINRIGVLRSRANLSARALSLEIGKNPGYINRLESKRDFVPTINVLLDIIEVCGSTPEEFFYSNIFEYKSDKRALDYFKRLTEKQKAAILNLYEDER